MHCTINGWIYSRAEYSYQLLKLDAVNKANDYYMIFKCLRLIATVEGFDFNDQFQESMGQGWIVAQFL